MGWGDKLKKALSPNKERFGEGSGRRSKRDDGRDQRGENLPARRERRPDPEPQQDNEEESSDSSEDVENVPEEPRRRRTDESEGNRSRRSEPGDNPSERRSDRTESSTRRHRHREVARIDSIPEQPSGGSSSRDPASQAGSSRQQIVVSSNVRPNTVPTGDRRARDETDPGRRSRRREQPRPPPDPPAGDRRSGNEDARQPNRPVEINVREQIDPFGTLYQINRTSYPILPATQASDAYGGSSQAQDQAGESAYGRSFDRRERQGDRRREGDDRRTMMTAEERQRYESRIRAANLGRLNPESGFVAHANTGGYDVSERKLQILQDLTLGPDREDRERWRALGTRWRGVEVPVLMSKACNRIMQLDANRHDEDFQAAYQRLLVLDRRIAKREQSVNWELLTKIVYDLDKVMFRADLHRRICLKWIDMRKINREGCPGFTKLPGDFATERIVIYMSTDPKWSELPPGQAFAQLMHQMLHAYFMVHCREETAEINFAEGRSPWHGVTFMEAADMISERLHGEMQSYPNLFKVEAQCGRALALIPRPT